MRFGSLVFALPLIALGIATARADDAANSTKVDQSPMPIKVVRAFPELRLNRPIVFTWDGVHADQMYVVSQLGKIHTMPNDQKATEDDLKPFLDWEEHITYKDKENEEGLLGLAFHPKFKQNGEFFLHYTSADEPEHTNVIARFKVGKDGKADPKSQEVLLKITHPYWNHKGGGLAFGPDGYLYISVGDGGKANDPFGNGQKLDTLLGKILRIDVDQKTKGKNYSIPKDNPFVTKQGAAPEIYAYGLRNVWGLTFDQETKLLWAADVGQDIWEEIDIIKSGGNYGWNLREGFHKFPLGPNGGSEPRKDLIEPIWEYHHDIGKSITGGYVYRGRKLPDLVGHYLYADYVSGKVWALKYDSKSGKTVANRELTAEQKMPYIAFGFDADNELYLTDSFGQFWTLEKK